MKTTALPYLRPYPERIQIKEWSIIQEDISVPLREFMPEWDATTDITLSAKAEINLAGILNDCKLSSNSELVIVSAWDSSGTGLRDCSNVLTIDSSLTHQVIILDWHLTGAFLSAEIMISISLVLKNAADTMHQFAPKLAGSLLWRDQRKIVLEGSGTRFPVEMVNFAESFSWLPENAGWFLDWDQHDFTRPVLGGMRLYINSNHKQLKSALNGTQDNDSTIREVISFEVARTMIMTALDDREFLINAELYEDDTVGASIRRLLHALFVNNTLQELVEYRKGYSNRFDCELQDRLRLFWKD